MMILVCYDVATSYNNGTKRLNKVAKICKDYGQRVQNSVFECQVTPSDYLILKHKLEKTIDLDQDALRFYHLGKNWQSKLETLGKDYSYDPEKDSFIY